MSRSGKRYLWGIVIICVLLAGGLFLYQVLGRNGSNQKFRTVKVERGEISFVVTATGTINPVVNVLVGSQVSGTIKALYADFNSRVKEGQVIAQIDPAIFQAQVDQAKANVLKAQANQLNAKVESGECEGQSYEGRGGCAGCEKDPGSKPTACRKESDCPGDDGYGPGEL